MMFFFSIHYGDISQSLFSEQSVSIVNYIRQRGGLCTILNSMIL